MESRTRWSPLVSVLGLATLGVLAVALTWRMSVWRGSRTAEPAELSPGAKLSAAASVEAHERHASALSKGGTSVQEPAGSNEPAPRQSRRVCVEDLQGASISGATIFLRDEAGLRECGVTAADGCVAITEGESPPLAFHARADGYSAGRSAVSPASADPIVLRLAPATRISGRVRLPDGADAGPDVIVIAVPVDTFVDLRLSMEQFLREPDLLHTRTLADSSFELSGLDPRKPSYTLFAAGQGCASAEPLKGVRPAATDVSLVIAPVYALGVRWVTPDGSTARVCNAFGYADDRRSKLSDPDAQWITRLQLQARLLGLGGDEDDPESYADLFIACSKSGRRVSELGPVELAWTPPGYFEISESFMLPSLAQGLATRDVLLSPSTDGFGDVRVSVHGLPAELLRASRIDTPLIVRLKDSKGRSFSFGSSSPHGVLLRNVPSGSYAMSVDLPPTATGIPAPEISIADGVVEHQVTVASVGSIELLPRFSSGVAYDGMLSVFVGCGAQLDAGRPLAGGVVKFSRPPYQLPIAKAGVVTLELQFPRPSGGRARQLIDANQQVSVALELD